MSNISNIMGYENPFNSYQNRILVGETVGGLTYVHPLVLKKFFGRTVEKTGRLYFPDGSIFSNSQNARSIDIEIKTDVDTTIKEEDFIVRDFYFDKNKDKIYGSSGDKLAYKLYVFISKDGNKVKEAYEVTDPNDNEIILFLEDNDGDFLSETVMYGKVAQNLKEKHRNGDFAYSQFYGNTNISKSLEKNTEYKLSQDLISKLLENGYIEEEKTIASYFVKAIQYVVELASLPAKAIGWILQKIGEGIDFLSIPDAFWDTESPDYIFNEDNIIKHLTIDDATIE
ncbi:MAG: hypothetical protein ACK5M1_07105, partial [Xanthomarina gelatinilytica]